MLTHSDILPDCVEVGSGLRDPFEGVFSKFEKRARYRGLAKVQFQLFMDAIVWNVKRLVQINPPRINDAHYCRTEHVHPSHFLRIRSSESARHLSDLTNLTTHYTDGNIFPTSVGNLKKTHY